MWYIVEYRDGVWCVINRFTKKVVNVFGGDDHSRILANRLAQTKNDTQWSEFVRFQCANFMKNGKWYGKER